MRRESGFDKSIKDQTHKRIKKQPVAPRFVIRGKKLDDDEVAYNKASALSNMSRIKSQRKERVTNMKGFYKRRKKNKIARKQRALNRRVA